MNVQDKVRFTGSTDGYLLLRKGDIGIVLQLHEGIFKHPYVTVQLTNGDKVTTYAYRWEKVNES